jgi:hypothetical protein
MFSDIQKQIDKYANYLDAIKASALQTKEQLKQNKIQGLIEKEQLQSIEENSKGKVIGADSGFFESSLTGLDFCYIKSSGSYFEYNSKLVKYERLTENPIYEFKISDSILQKDEIQKFVSIARLKQELSLLENGIKNKNPDYALIDGNILPQPVDRPNNNSQLYSQYEELLDSFVRLYDLAKSQNTVLIGAVEDSRANSFLKLALNEKDFLHSVNDILYLNYILEKHECISFFPIYSVESNIIYNDLKQYGDFNFYSSYLKVNDDYPLRIELQYNNFSENKLKEIKGFISYISSYSKDYCFPSVLLDADKQAKLNANEVNIVKNLVDSSILSHGIKHLRRERRI